MARRKGNRFRDLGVCTAQSSLPALDTFLKNYHEKSIVVTFVNMPYFPIFERWYSCFRRCCDKGLLVVALDEKVYDTLTKRRIDSIFLKLEEFNNFLSTKEFDQSEKKLLSSLWKLRLIVFHRIIENGIDLIHSDSDAVWLDNPLPELNQYNHDLIASIGHSWPKPIAQKWGFILCMGFFILRSTPSSKILLGRLLTLMEEHNSDDQIAMNSLLLSHGVTWRKLTQGGHETEIKKFDLRILAAHEQLISRNSLDVPKIFHPYLKGDLLQKTSQLDKGLHEIRRKIGLQLSYERRHPIPKSGKVMIPLIHRHLEIFGASIPVGLTRRLLFVHIPKTGGTMIQEMLSLDGRGHLRITDSEDADRVYSFAVSRNPYSRLVSAFHYLTDRENLPEHDHEESAYVAAYGADFRRFVTEVVASYDIYRSIHLIPQTFYICNDSRIVINRLFAIENLKKDIEPFFRRLGVAWKAHQVNRSRHHSIESYYDKDTREIVARIYEQDFKILKYDPLGATESPPSRRE